MKKYLTILGILCCFLDSNAQLGIINNNPDPNAVLDLNPGGSTTNIKGLRLPNVKLKATDQAAPLTAHVSGMMVYNTATDGTAPTQVTPGVYCNDGTQWTRIDTGTTDLWGLTGNYDTIPASNFIGTTDGVDFAVRTANTERMRVTAAGKTLIGTTTIPTGGTNAKMIVNSSTAGAVQIKDGTQGVNKVFTSDANGVGSWQPQASSNAIVQTLTGDGVELTTALTAGKYLYTGNKITLGPGRWQVSATVFLLRNTYVSGENESWWVRSTFSDSSTTLGISSDIAGSSLISGTLNPRAFYGLLSGSIIINNTSTSNKTYYYIAGSLVTVNPTMSIKQFGASFFTESYFMIQKLQ